MKAELQKIGDKFAVSIPDAILKNFDITKNLDIRLDGGRIIIAPIKSKKGRPENFVKHVMAFCENENKAALAALKGADNPQRQDKSYDYLAQFYIEFDSPNEYLPYLTIAAAIAKANVKHNGQIGIGRAIARCYGTTETGENKKEVDPQAKTKIRRLLACDSIEDVCRVLRPLFSLIDAKGLSNTLNYVSLLHELSRFHIDGRREEIKQEWAIDFYKRLGDKDKKDGEDE